MFMATGSRQIKFLYHHVGLLFTANLNRAAFATFFSKYMSATVNYIIVKSILDGLHFSETTTSSSASCCLAGCIDDLRCSGVARAFPGGRLAHPEGQNEEENEKSLRKNTKKLLKFEEK